MSKQIEVFTDELFAAIEEHNLLKAEECIATADYVGVSKVLNGEKYGMKPISFAVKENSLEILNLLVTSGANVNAANSEDLKTALHVAAEYGREEAGQFLLSHRANVNLQDTRGKTPLHLASFHCRVGMVKLLIDNNATPNIRDVDGEMASDVVGDNPELMCEDHIIQKILSMLKSDVGFDYKAILPTRNLKALEANDTADVIGNVVKSSSFINNICSWMRASTTSALSSLFCNAPALPSAQQSIIHSARSTIDFSQNDLNGTALLTDVIVRKLTGKKHSMSLDDSLLTLEKVKERKVNAIKEKFDMAMSKFDLAPKGLLSNSTISKKVSVNSRMN